MEPHWLVRPRTIRALWILLLALLAGAVLLQRVFPVKAHFGIDGSFAFNAWFGFAACAVMVAVARLLGWFLKRRDDYYGKDP